MQKDETTININFSSIFFQSYSIDESDHPIYVFDSTYLPSFESIGNKDTYDTIIDKLTDKLISKLPNEPYSLVAFTSGFGSNKISWVYGIKMYAKLPQSSKNYLQKIHIVHESFWVRSVYQVLKNAMNIKFLNNNSNEVVIDYISDLSQLSQIIDITRLRISLNVYLHDYEINEFIEVPKHTFKQKYDYANREYRQSMFDKIFKRLIKESSKTDLVFMKPGSFKKINILLDIIDRNNYVDLSQWDIYSVAGVFFYFIKTKTNIFFPVDMIPLPIKDDFQYTFQTFKKMMDFHNYYSLLVVLFPLFIKLIENQKITKHDYTSMSKCLVGPLCRETVSKENNDRIMIGSRFIKNVLLNVDEITKQMESPQLRPELTPKLPPVVPKPRKVSTQLRAVSSNDSTENVTEKRSVKLEQPPTPPPPRLSPKLKSAAIVHPGKLLKPSKLLTSAPPPVLPKPRNFSNVSLDSLTSSRASSPSPPPCTLKSRNLSTASLSPILLSPEKLCMDEDPLLNTKSATKSTANEKGANKENDISKRIRDQPEAVDIVTVDEKMVWETIKKLQIDNNSKIQSFDKKLQMAKQETLLKNKTEINRFSKKSYSDFKSEGNKVSQLAMLYEERLQGFQIINQISKK